MISVRSATVDDAEAMARVNAAGWRAGYRDIVPKSRLDHLPESRWRREMRDGLSDPQGDSFTLVAEFDGEFAGYCYVAAPAREGPEGSKTCELVALYVDPKLWRRGIGRVLVEAVIAEAARLGWREMVLWVFEPNQPAQDLYMDAGFAADGESRPFVPLGIPTIRMRRALSQSPVR